MKKKWILIATFTHPHEAIFIKGTLANFGIKSYLKSDLRQFNNPFYASPVSRRRLYIYKNDIPDALAVFAQTEFHGHFTILLNKSHLRLADKNLRPIDPDKKICRICACVYTVIMVSVLISLFHSFLGF
jgi:hypothetical protein